MRRNSLIIGAAVGVATASIAAALLVGVPGTHPLFSGAQVFASTDSPQNAATDGGSLPATAGPSGKQQAQVVPDAEADALAKTLKISHAQAVQRMKQQAVNTDKADSIDQKLGAQGAGSWLDAATGAVHTNVLNAQAAAVAKAGGATPHLVTNSQADLTAIQDKLDAAATSAPKNASWGVDVTTDKVDVTVTRDTPAATVTGYLAKAGIIGADQTKVSVHTNGRPLKFRGLVGGDDTEIYSKGKLRGWCSVGFLATRPNGARVMLTAGHCTQLGTEFRRDPDKKRIGFLRQYSFGTKGDWSVVNVDKPTSWTPTGPYVNRHASTFQLVAVTGSKQARIGDWICKSGQTSGWTCGRLTSKGWSGQIQDDSGNLHTVSGLSGSSLCTQPGDSGGSVLFHNQAQGMISAGVVGNCDPKYTDAADPNTLFQPVNPVLAAAKLKLIVRH